ncbi:MAG: SDR family oxidoreductase [Fodinibius sp.]|nr:SDR family oxidoreductase [Fodinibius sp.]
MSEQDYSVVITGASRGIGRRIAQAFARNTDYALLLVARTKSDLQDTKTLCAKEGDNDIAIASCDAADPKAAGNISLPKGFSKPRFVINNAGSYLLKSLQKTSHEEFEQQMQSESLLGGEYYQPLSG